MRRVEPTSSPGLNKPPRGWWQQSLCSWFVVAVLKVGPETTSPALSPLQWMRGGGAERFWETSSALLWVNSWEKFPFLQIVWHGNLRSGASPQGRAQGTGAGEESWGPGAETDGAPIRWIQSGLKATLILDMRVPSAVCSFSLFEPLPQICLYHSGKHHNQQNSPCFPLCWHSKSLKSFWFIPAVPLGLCTERCIRSGLLRLVFDRPCNNCGTECETRD